MAIPVGTLAKGAIGTSLLGGGITGGTLYGTAHKNYSDFLNKFEEIVTSQVQVHSPLAEALGKDKENGQEKRIIGTIKCDYWIETNKYSYLTKEEKLLECARDRNHQLKERVRQGIEQLEKFRQLTEKQEK